MAVVDDDDDGSGVVLMTKVMMVVSIGVAFFTIVVVVDVFPLTVGKTVVVVVDNDDVLPLTVGKTCCCSGHTCHQMMRSLRLWNEVISYSQADYEPQPLPGYKLQSLFRLDRSFLLSSLSLLD